MKSKAYTNLPTFKRKKIVLHQTRNFREELKGKLKIDVINTLRKWTEIKTRNNMSYSRRRKIFNKIKWKFFRKWITCGACKSASVEHIHHIVMLKNGGTNDESNLIGLCYDCHVLIHDWMKPKKLLETMNNEYLQVVS